MFAIGSDEFKSNSPIGDTVKCKVCGELHNVEYGDKINEGGTKEKSKLLAFITCPTNGNYYLVGINGKEI